MEEKEINNFPPIETSNVLTEEEMYQISGGSYGRSCKSDCSDSCKPDCSDSCKPGKKLISRP